MRKIIISFVLYFRWCLSGTADLNISDGRKNGGFFFTMPKTLESGRNESVCLSLHHFRHPSKVVIDLTYKGSHFLTNRAIESDHTCFSMYVPKRNLLEPHLANVKVQVTDTHQTHTAHNLDPILMYPVEAAKVFVETDREIYKPGDLIKIRTLVIDQHFTPGASKISEIRIKNPLDVNVFVWDNVALDHGLAILEYKLVNEAMIGKWKIEVAKTSKQIEVAKYIVPKFKIDLTYPKSVYHQSDSLTISACAKYSFNKPVAGIAFVKIYDSISHMKPVNKLQEMYKGCAHFYITREELSLADIHGQFLMGHSKIFLHIKATITEQGSTNVDIASGKAEIHLKHYWLKFQSGAIFIPGVPYEGKLKIYNAITTIESEVVEICYNLAIKKSWNYFNDEQCANYTVPEDGVIPFKLWPLKSSVLHVHLHAKSVKNNNIEDSLLVVRLYSLSSSYISIIKDFEINETCPIHHHYRILYTADNFQEGENVTFYYMIKTNSGLYKVKRITHTVKKRIAFSQEANRHFVGTEHKYIKLGTTIDEFPIILKVEKLTFRYQILVYYVTKDGETVASSKSQDVTPCSFKVNASWNEKQLVPGKMAKLHIKSEQKGLCAVTATDKASDFFAESQHLHWDRISKVMSQQREYPKSPRPTCINTHKKTQSKTLTNVTSTRPRRHVFPFSEDRDSYDVFNKFGVITITNLKVVTKPCYHGPLQFNPNEAEFMIDQYNNAIEEASEITVRSYFPENWLWELVPIETATVMARELPHSITSWTTNVFCVSETAGVSFAPPTEITSFQPFFIEIIAPYSAKKDEHFYLPVNIFNYLDYSFPIRIALKMSGNIQLTNQRSSLTASYCLKESDTITHNYQITGMKVGPAQVTVSVETDNQYPLPCGPEVIVSKRDAMLKTINIEPEGFKEVKTNSALMCTSDQIQDNSTIWNLKIPDGIVTGTNKTFISVNADLLGSTIENLKQLITIPTGCGEQIMASLAPNLYILRYMNATQTLTPMTRQKIIRSFKIGYQRILNYMHKDGSFSAFGYNDPDGSMFLTTFVVKILQQIKMYVYVDQRIIDKAVEWIYSNQLENGCFDAMYHVFHDMGGTDTERSTSALTSYVILSLLEANIEIPKSVLGDAKYCIRNQGNPDRYSLIISCYAMLQMQWMDEGVRFLEHILAAANKENSMTWWSFNDNGDEDHTSDIEMTSYALLALMRYKTSTNLAHARSIVRWLSSKIGPTGAFRSTQDTVVALDALTVYAEYIHPSTLDININIETAEERHSIALTSADKIKGKKMPLRITEGKLDISISGVGCVLIQLIQTYHSLHVPKSEYFKLAVDVASVSNVDACSVRKISPCVTYNGQNQLSNMAVMEMGLPSGYIADKASLENLINRGNYTKIKKFEETENQINLYFTKLDKSEICFSFSIIEQSKLERRKDNTIKMYDYYNPEEMILHLYKVSNNCTQDNIKKK
ncbi:alpha-1-macroglobulin-like isoform X1 [Rhynchophorus ferrugineus]|uniref:alpha-1-macroglobulin-like isoform X1 n=1 Tax=Rhynchophorus ferrugineus TaxID=354439 RepID=UPI003FCD0A38